MTSGGWLGLSAAVPVTLSVRRCAGAPVRRCGQRSLAAALTVVTLFFTYAAIANTIGLPNAVMTVSLFIAAAAVFSLLSRILCATQLRGRGVELDDLAWQFIEDAAASGEIHIANKPLERDEPEYRVKELAQRQDLHLPNAAPVLFVEVTVADPTHVEAPVRVRGEERHGYRILRVDGVSVANSIAALLLEIRDLTGETPHVYLGWTDSSPAVDLLRYLLLGDGEVVPLTREVLRDAEHNPDRRPMVHVG
jgi:hypothetical protein